MASTKPARLPSMLLEQQLTNKRVIQITGVLMLAAFLVFVAMVATSREAVFYDEPYFVSYISLLHKFGFTAQYLDSLNAAPGPLCAVIQVIFEPLTHVRPVGMRLVNVSLLVMLSLVLGAWLKRTQKDYWVAAASIMIVPMTWVLAGLALSEMPALLLVTISLCLELLGLEELEGGRRPEVWFLLAGVCLGLSIWGRQPYLLLNGIPILLALRDRRLRASAAIFVVVATAIALPLFLIWKGPLPPLRNLHEEGFSIPFGFTSFGYAAICFILLGAWARWLPLKVVLGLVAATIVLNAAVGHYELYPIRDAMIRHMPVKLQPVYGSLCGSLFLSVGVVFLAVLLKLVWDSRSNLKMLTVNAGFLCVVASPVFIGHQYSSRYTGMALPYLIFAAQPWRKWQWQSIVLALIGCGIGCLSLYGYLASVPE